MTTLRVAYILEHDCVYAWQICGEISGRKLFDWWICLAQRVTAR